jgi:biopolymer transport protein ExbD
MAEIIANEGGGKKKGKKRAKRHSTHIDMTPMVDLACLLLTFFMLTTAFSKPKVMEIVLPEKSDKPGPKVSNPISIILDEKDRIFWYNGLADPTKPPLPTIYVTDFSKDGIRKVLLDRNKVLFKKIETFNNDILKGKLALPLDTVTQRIKDMKRSDKTGPRVVLIKATDKAKYKNFVDVIDEMAITNIPRYAVVDISPFELKLINKTKKDNNIQ